MASSGQETPWRVEILREVDGYTPGDARRIAAVRNIQNDSGTAIDAAKVLRESGGDVATLRLPPKSPMVQNATGLAKLNDDAFGMVVNEVATIPHGATVGRLVQDQKAQTNLLGLLTRLAKTKAIPQSQAETIVRQAMANTVTETQIDMFGDLGEDRLQCIGQQFQPRDFRIP